MTAIRNDRDPSDVPSMLDLIRMSPRPIFPPGGRDLYRQIAILTEMEPGKEVLVASCGIGVTAEYFVREFGVQGSGVDESQTLIDRGAERIRVEDIQERLQFQQASMDDLPYRDGVFDVTVGELGLTATVRPEVTIPELVRVTRPGGHVVLVQPVWKAPVDEARQTVLIDHLGARPQMMVEVKRILRESGVRKLHTEAWSDNETAFRRQARKPFPDFAELFTLTEKIGILRRAWRRWGWRGVRAAISREQEVHRLLTRERILGLDMVLGRKIEVEEPTDSRDASTSSDAPPSADEPTSSDGPPTSDATPSSDPPPSDEPLEP